MNNAIIIGNVCNDPELRVTKTGVNVCDFVVAVDSRKRKDPEGKPIADFFHCTAWRQLAEICSRCLARGKKVCVIGEVTAKAFQRKGGDYAAQLEISIDSVEFLSPRSGSERPQERFVSPRSNDIASDQRAAAEAFGEREERGEWTDVKESDLPF